MIESLTPYGAILSARFRTLLQYRAAAIAGLTTQVFWGWIRVMIFEAFYLSSASEQPINLADVITYIWLGQALFRFIPWDVEKDIQQMIRDGNVAYEMLRPVDVYWLWFSRVAAMRLAPTMLRAVPMAAMAVLFFGMTLPPSWSAFGAWCLATCGAVVLACAITTCVTITLMWTVSGLGITRLLPGIVMALSGMSIPIPLLPDALQPILLALPFAGLIDMPFRLYLGNLPPNAVWWTLAIQGAWSLAFIALGRWLWSRGSRRLVVQGG
ncbi:MAG: ABC-2 family transporter protein [Candidatus Poribacteria bacterium]|nr:ABC-2 family transporter protein [Candidatus Poribacteria bacterium]